LDGKTFCGALAGCFLYLLQAKNPKTNIPIKAGNLFGNPVGKSLLIILFYIFHIRMNLLQNSYDYHAVS